MTVTPRTTLRCLRATQTVQMLWRIPGYGVPSAGWVTIVYTTTSS
jgi:hypothetical protein